MTAAAQDAPASRVSGVEAYRRVREQSRALCAPLSEEDCAIQSMPDASPAKWHLAHTTWFFETFVLEALPGFRAFDPAYRFLFNSYYNTVGEQYSRPHRGLLSRPSLSEVHAYRSDVDARVDAASDEWEADERLRSIVEIGVQHEQQHQELLLTDVKHMLGCNPLRPAYDPSLPESAIRTPEPIRWRSFAAGLSDVGHAGDGFAFDNEGPCHPSHLTAFGLASRPTTNGEYRAFVEEGGYDRPEFWLSDGWAWRQAEHVEAPHYWLRRDGEWTTLTLGGERVLRDDEPVTHVSFFEASAFAEWSGYRLPTEQEWERAADETPVDGNLLDTGLLHPAPAASDVGLMQMFGDVWEWTRSDYSPYPGFRAPVGALGEYNGKFMCNQFVLRGGSCATWASHIRPTYRNFFPPSARWQFSGFRLARDEG